jgi:hypothetical protein
VVLRWTIVSLFVSFFLAASSRAAEYYVSPQGDNASPGTIAKPFRTIQAGPEHFCYHGGLPVSPDLLSADRSEA